MALLFSDSLHTAIVYNNPNAARRENTIEKRQKKNERWTGKQDDDPGGLAALRGGTATVGFVGWL